jgi:adenylate cyclase
MFTDIAGYTALTQDDEEGALALLEDHHRLLRPLFRTYRGREVKAVGDAFLVEFESALEATRCALEIRRTLVDQPLNARDGSTVRLRIGIHLGDVVDKGGDVFGDAVNIAARVQGLADPGGICLTQQVYDQVRNKLPVAFRRLPPTTLKNVRHPVTVYALEGSPGGSMPGAAPLARSAGRHLAVLPLTSISPDPQDEYFADGLTEELISVLSQVQDLMVIARTSVMPYKSAPKPIREVGSELGVDTVLEGSVRKAGNRIRITLQLLDVASQSHLWASSYNRELDDVFAVQTDIAERTAESLRLQLTGSLATGHARRPTSNLEAYDLYLRGLVAARLHQSTTPAGARERTDVDEAVRCFEQATRLDPAFAEAFAAWSNLYVSAAADSIAMADVMPRARELAARAIELDPTSSQAHATLGNIAFQFDQDWGLAEREFRQAIALNPSNVTAHRFLGLMLIALRRFDEAKEEIHRAMRLDPGGHIQGSLAMAELYAGNLDAAVRVAEEIRDSNPESGSLHILAGLFYAEAGRTEEAEKEAAAPFDPSDEDERFDHAILAAVLGRPEEGRAVLADCERGAFRTYVSGTHRAILHAALGEHSKALDLLEEAFREGDKVLWIYYPAVYFRSLREHPRFLALLRRYRLSLDSPQGAPPARRRSQRSGRGIRPAHGRRRAK